MQAQRIDLAKIWLSPLAAGLLAIAISVLSPPAFWLCGIGAAILACVSIANSSRTGEWTYIPWRLRGDDRLTHAETAAGLTAATLIAVPLIVVVVRSFTA